MLVLQSQWKAGTTEMGRDQTDWRRILDQVEEQHFLIPPGQNGGGGGRGSGESTQVHHLVWEAHDVQMHSRCTMYRCIQDAVRVLENAFCMGELDW